MNKRIRLKRDRRSTTGAAFYAIGGFCLLMMGIVVGIISIPLCFVVVGIFTGMGAITMIAAGASMMSGCTYKNETINCPNCGFARTLNIGMCPNKSFKCKRCKEVVLVE